MHKKKIALNEKFSLAAGFQQGISTSTTKKPEAIII